MDSSDEYGLLAAFLAALSAGASDEANTTFQRFISQHPNSNTTTDAVQYLQELAGCPRVPQDNVDRYRRTLANRLIELRA